MLSQRVKNTIQWVIVIALGLFLLWVTTRHLTDEEVSRVKQLFLSAKWMWVVPCIGALILSHYIRALRWKMLIDPLGVRPRVHNVFLSVLIGYFLNLLLPRLGEVMKCTFLNRYEKAPVDKLIGTIVTERVIDLASLVVVIFLTILLQLKMVSGYAQEIWLNISSDGNNTLNLLFIGTAFLVGTWIFFRLFTQGTHPILIRIKRILKGLQEGMLSVRNVRNKGLFIAYTALIWFLYLTSIRLAFFSLEEVDVLSWAPALTVLTFGSFAMIATQGGIGAYQLAVQKTLGLYGIQEVPGLAMGWLLWSTQTVFLLVAGPVSILLMLLLNRKRKSTSIS
ncbi:MAG: flippase-like domain-containing protein [Bacteroidetes bacterium]|nr:flippase-like domain-containing protein [Bacteroidota bacterium]